MSRYFATAGLRSAAFAHPREGFRADRQPDVCRCAAVKKKHIPSSAISTRNLPNRSPVQKRLSIYNWNPGPRRGKEDGFEKQIAGKWHVITLQEASEYVDHDILTNRFHVTHYGGCAVLYNKDTFYPNIDVKSIYPS